MINQSKSIKKKRVVVIGGGNGSAIAIVALKQHLEKFDISAVVTMADSGGSSGRLRKEFNTLPPGDVLRAILAMSKYEYPLLKKIFYGNRFDKLGQLNQHNLGNLFITLSQQYSGDFVSALRALEQGVEAVGKVYPVTLDVTDLCVELNNGRVIKTEAAIDKPTYSRSWEINQAWLEPKAGAYRPAVQTIEQADYIVIAPGSLYTSVVAALLPIGVRAAIARSKAIIVYAVGNGYRPNSETGPECLSGFVGQLEKYLPRPIDTVIYNNHKLSAAQKKKYRAKKWSTFAYDPENLPNHKIISRPFERDEGGLCSIKLGKILNSVLK